MKQLKIKKLMCLITVLTSILLVQSVVWAKELPNHEYVDFSSDRSTWFFRVEGGDNQTVFFDFYSPFDPTVKVEVYDPLAMYKLEQPYYIDEQGSLMIHVEDLKKMYAPYFDYTIENDVLYLRHTAYDKLVTDGYGERATTIEYTKKVWDMTLNLEGNQKNSGSYSYTEYVPTTGGRNKPAIGETEVNETHSRENVSFDLQTSVSKDEKGAYYVPLAQVMTHMGKVSIEAEGYLAIQSREMYDITVEVKRSEEVAPVVVPHASNPWHGGSVEAYDESYTWADYMNEVSDGIRKTGWFWQAFYIPSGNDFKDANGNEVTLEADRIVPVSIYVPNQYNQDETRMTYMLHGGTGNENTPTYRIMKREMHIDQVAEKYNYILVSPNGWIQNPIWRQGQALYSFEKSFELVMEAFPVDEEKVFIMGNSLGGRGTLELAMRFPEKFRAMAPSAVKITEKDSEGKKIINIEGTQYDLSDIQDMPTMIIQGTVDSTTSYKVQIGSSSSPGAITSAIMPKLSNSTYLTVEQGNHSYAYGSVLEAIFDFFEETLGLQKEHTSQHLTLYEKSKSAVLGNTSYTLQHAIKLKEGIAMMALSDLEALYGEMLKAYYVQAYDSDLEKSVSYWTIVGGHTTLNLIPNEIRYRKNMERYKEDATLLKSSAASDENQLEAAPQFTIAPYEEEGELFVPVKEVMEVFDLQVVVTSQVVSKPMLLIGGALGILGLSMITLAIKNKKK